MKELEKLKSEYPQAEYDDALDVIFENGDDDAKIVATGAKRLISEHYNGYELQMAHASGDPALETKQEATGSQYIREMYDDDYEKAFSDILGN